ncbi:membrane-associated protein, putative [Bodo saltans]|uniref:Membrane-associated protein, putative n=1 Tax=Bodo saltans TaxID=75058 RepID=A0A0S4JGV1_BODSA|nr:membrane-associated protein, putative [Bodo saltans]|eukprot:CUG89326.1 membrane-associated protein, putative [Bodo saltans]
MCLSAFFFVALFAFCVADAHAFGFCFPSFSPEKRSHHESIMCEPYPGDASAVVVASSTALHESSPSSPPSTVLELALELMAMSHHRDVSLQAALLRWHQKTETAQRHRRRREITAEMFFHHRLQFITFRAWQWEFHERQKIIVCRGLADSFRQVWDQKHVWLRWRRYHQTLKRANGVALALRERRKFSVVHCGGTAALSNPSSDANGCCCCCRWHSWARRARLSLALRTLSRQTTQRYASVVLTRWRYSHLFALRPQRIVAEEASCRLQSEASIASSHHWALQSYSIKLQVWHRAVYTINTVLMPKVRLSLQMKLWSRWRNKAALRMLMRRTVFTLRTDTYRKLLAHLVKRRYERHTEASADAAVQRRCLHRWSVLRAQKTHRDELLANADERYAAQWNPRMTRFVFAFWLRRCSVRRRRQDHLQECSMLRKGLLAGLLLRRLADAATPPAAALPYEMPRLHLGKGVGNDRLSTSPLFPPLPADVGNGEDDVPSRVVRALTGTMQLKPIPLSMLSHVQQHLSGGGGHGGGGVSQLRETRRAGDNKASEDHVSKSSLIVRFSPIPSSSGSGGHEAAIPLSRIRQSSPGGNNNDDGYRHGITSTPHSSVRFMSAKKAQVEHLLDRFHQLQRTSHQDKIAFRQLSDRLDRLRRETRSSILNSAQQPSVAPTIASTMAELESELHSVRQRIESRAMLRSQIVMLQREIRNWMEDEDDHRVSGGGGGGGGVHFLDTPRSDASFRR